MDYLDIQCGVGDKIMDQNSGHLGLHPCSPTEMHVSLRLIKTSISHLS